MADSLAPNDLRINSRSFDYGRRIGVAIEYKGKRVAVRIDNPFWPEIDREWHERHPDHA